MAWTDNGVLVSFPSIRKRSKLLLGGGLLAAALAIAPGAVNTAAWAAPLPTTGLDYVALGDSYAVGLALGPVDGSVPGCGQTAASYPRQLALTLELNLTDVTCSGATTDNILNTAQVTNNGVNPVQSTALSPDTDLVTLTIGGNDLGFTSIIQNCLALAPTGPLLLSSTTPNCKESYTASGFDSLAAAVAGPVTAALSNTLAKVNELAPNAKVFVVGYPALMPDAANTPLGGCFTPFDGLPTAFPFTNVDVPYLHAIQSQLDAAMAATATTAGATFVPMLANTLRNSPCANNPNAAVNGASFLPGAMHPNALGAGLMFAETGNAIQGALTAPAITPASTSFDLPVNVPASLTFTATGFPQPTFTVNGQLPDGMLFDAATGVLSGIPNAAGASVFSLTATNGVDVATEQYTVSVTEAPAITSSTPPSTGTVDTPYSFTVTASGFPAPTFAVTSGVLPDGLQLDPATGLISGTPTATGTFNFGVTAANFMGSVTSPAYSIQVSPAAVAPQITSSAPPEATVGTEYSFTVTATGFPAPTFAVTSGALPAGLALDGISGAITGTPSAAGSHQFTITASNGTDPAATAQYTLLVKQSSNVTPPVTPPVTPVVTPVTPTKTGLATTGAGSLLPLGVGGGIALLAGAGLLLTRRLKKR